MGETGIAGELLKGRQPQVISSGIDQERLIPLCARQFGHRF